MTAIFDDQERLVKKVNIGLAYERDSRNDAIQVPLEDFESVLFPCPARAKGLGPKMADGKGRVAGWCGNGEWGQTQRRRSGRSSSPARRVKNGSQVRRRGTKRPERTSRKSVRQVMSVSQ